MMLDVAARDHLKSALRTTVGPFLRQQNFKGSGTSWLLRSPSNDVAIVNVQSSQFSSADDVRCVINLSVIPASWWDWQCRRLALSPSSAPKEQHGLWRYRLHPTGAEPGVDVWWNVTDEQSSTDVASDMVIRLQREGVPTLRRLLDRSEMIASVRRADLGHLKGDVNRRSFDRALAILLADEDPSAELEEVLLRLAVDHGDGAGAATRELIEWVTARASAK